MAAFKAYFDGSNSDSRCLTLACLATDEATWGQLEAAWEKVRKERGNPRCIHMTDLMALERDFKDWTPEKRDHLVDGLLNVFLEFKEHPRVRSFACSVDLVAYNKWKQYRDLPPAARLCARSTFPQMTAWYEKLPDLILQAIEAYFDRNEPYLRHIEPDWRSKKLVKKFPGWALVKTIVPVDMEHSPAIQMADVIAWGRNRLQAGSHWETDPHYTTAVRSARTISWQYQVFDEHALATVNFKPEGYEAIDPQRRAFLAKKNSKQNELERMIQKFLKSGEADIRIRSKED